MNSKGMETLDFHANSILAASYSHPSAVMADDMLTVPQKRCILAAWASDAFAVEDKPWHRQLPGQTELIPLAEILSALRRLDEDDDDGPPPRHGGVMPVPLHGEIELRSAVGF